VHAQNSFEFAVIRIVPRVDREEFVNAGVIVFCLGQKFLRALVEVDEARLRALWPDLDLNLLRENLAVFPKICSGAADGGPIAKLSLRERFHWMVSPRSTVIQISPVHSGLCESPEAVLQELFHQLVTVAVR
jgi:DUF3037 family protein